VETEEVARQAELAASFAELPGDMAT